MDTYGLSEKHIEHIITKTDKRRANYYSYFSNQKWGQADNYDLVLNTSKISIEDAAEIIKAYILLKQK